MAAAETAKQRQARKRAQQAHGTPPPTDGKPQPRRIDFNRIVRTITGDDPYPTLQGQPLRLGKVVTDAIMGGSGRKARGGEAEDTTRMNQFGQLLDHINRTDFAQDAVETGSFGVLALSETWVKAIDEEVTGSGFLRGVKLSVHRMLFPEEALPPLEGIEVLAVKDVEQAQVIDIDRTPDEPEAGQEEDGEDGDDAEESAGPTAGDLAA